MSVDKFGRHSNVTQGLRGPKGVGFELTPDGNFDIEHKKLCHVANATEKGDCVNLQTLIESNKHFSQIIDKKIESTKELIGNLEKNSLVKNDKKEFNVNSGIITHLSKPKHKYDAVNLIYFSETIAEITYAIYNQLHRKKKKKTKKEWKDFIVSSVSLDWGELFSVREEPRDKEHSTSVKQDSGNKDHTNISIE